MSDAAEHAKQLRTLDRWLSNERRFAYAEAVEQCGETYSILETRFDRYKEFTRAVATGKFYDLDDILSDQHLCLYCGSILEISEAKNRILGPHAIDCHWRRSVELIEDDIA